MAILGLFPTKSGLIGKIAQSGHPSPGASGVVWTQNPPLWDDKVNILSNCHHHLLQHNEIGSTVNRALDGSTYPG
jgi:hypothetical protein